MTQFLPPHLLKLFEARPPLKFLPSVKRRKNPPYYGVGSFVDAFEDPKTVDWSKIVKETPQQAREKHKKAREEANKAKLEQNIEKYDPQNNEGATGDPYKTLFVARLSYETTEHTLKKTFERYGPVVRVRMVYERDTHKPRGYAFVEFENEADMKTACREQDGRRIDDKRVLCDVERGRTVTSWKPRRLGGGLGRTRKGGKTENSSYSEREYERYGRERERERERGSSSTRRYEGGDRGGYDRRGGGSGGGRSGLGYGDRGDRRDRGDWGGRGGRDYDRGRGGRDHDRGRGYGGGGGYERGGRHRGYDRGGDDRDRGGRGGRGRDDRYRPY
eukprot:TRINITY_DN8386_c0_g1_i2.p1 TRINITY_DN8386_c0_g1~~TRINITY_DN8386_c0_g1_i2.p1  ORF type:complete len:331 (+),score=40.59 TRINITY_DN8386_c0_g1_i2:223-1215(+)